MGGSCDCRVGSGKGEGEGEAEGVEWGERGGGGLPLL